MSYTTLSIILITYGVGLYLWTKKTSIRLSDQASLKVRYVHYVFAGVVAISLALWWIDMMTFAGQWTNRIFIIGFLLTGMFMYPLTDWTGKRKLEKLYFGVFAFFPTFTGFLLLIPFGGPLVFSIAVSQLIYPVSKICYEDKNVRVQSSNLGPMWLPGIFVYEKKGIVERQLVMEAISDFQIDSVALSYQRERTLVIFFGHEGQMDTLKIKAIEWESNMNKP